MTMPVSFFSSGSRPILAGESGGAAAVALELHVAGPAGHICTVRPDSASSVEELKGLIVASAGIPVIGQRLFFGVEELFGLGRLADLLPAGAREETLLLLRRSPQAVEWLETFRERGHELAGAAEEVRADRLAVLTAVAERGADLEFASAELRAYRDVALVAVAQEWRALQYASAELRADRDVVLRAIKRGSGALQYASEELRADRDVVQAAIKKDGRALEHASAELSADRDVVLAAIAQDGRALEYASAELRSDHKVAMAAIRGDAGAIRYASARLRANRKFLLEAVAVERGMWILEYASEELQGDCCLQAWAALVELHDTCGRGCQRLWRRRWREQATLVMS